MSTVTVSRKLSGNNERRVIISVVRLGGKLEVADLSEAEAEALTGILDYFKYNAALVEISQASEPGDR